jgi:pimeloyl-ACP methyl ester carboxylesterase
MLVIVWIGALLLATVLLSYLVERLRSQPNPPDRLSWAPDVPIRYVNAGGMRLRYIVAGSGPALVLLHTLRTQLDMFQKVFPELAKRYRVYALDYPGHGYSDIPAADYTADFFTGSVARFLDALQIEDAILAGESIGGTIALLLAARHNPRVRGVVAVNPYDYASGQGLARSSPVAAVLLALGRIPVVGATFMRLRSPLVQRPIFRGGLNRKDSLPRALGREMYLVGNRRGHHQAFLSLMNHSKGWEDARREYGAIDWPVLLLYGDHDWSRPAEREADARDIPGAQLRTVEGAGHFLSLDAPGDWVRAVDEISLRQIPR